MIEKPGTIICTNRDFLHKPFLAPARRQESSAMFSQDYPHQRTA